MVGETDEKDKKESRKIAVLILSLVVVLAVAILLILPAMSSLVATQFTPGIGLRTSAVIAFFTTVVVMIVFAVAAGDGLLGEIQYMLSAFFMFFLVLWLMIAWLF